VVSFIVIFFVVGCFCWAAIKEDREENWLMYGLDSDDEGPWR